MASTYGSPVLFTKEKNVWTLSCRVVFDTNGAPILDTTKSKGFCAVWQNTPTFTAGTNGSSSLLGSVSSFYGLFPGMNLTIGSSLAIITSATIGSISAANAALNKFPVTAVNNAQNGFPQFDTPSVTFVAGSGGGGTGQYIFQLGAQAGLRLDPYVKLLGVNVTWDETTASATGAAGVRQLAPNAPLAILIDNNISQRTVPATTVSGSSDAMFVLQLGTGNGNGFTAGFPQAGEAMIVDVILGNSTAP